MANIVILASGGMKAAVVAGVSATESELVLLHVHYGQPSAAAERDALRAFAKTLPSARVLLLGFPHIMQLQKAFPGKGGESDRGQESRVLSSSSLRGMMPLLLMQGVQCALRVGAAKVLTGLTQFCDASHFGLPPAESPQGDRREFLHAFNIMLASVLPERSPVVVEAPLIDLGYAEVVKLANRLRVPLEKSWTCEVSGPQPCRRCGLCKARAGAFVEAGLVDPLSRPVPEAT